MIHGRKLCEKPNGCGKYYAQIVQDECPHCGNPEWASTFVPYNPLDWIYDLEVYPNTFTATFKHPNSGDIRVYEVSDRRNDCVLFIEFLLHLERTGSRLVGFNNVGYDYPIIHKLMNDWCGFFDAKDAFMIGDRIINTPWDDRFSNIIWDRDMRITQIDLYLVHHFDNSARRTSLKMLEFVMRSKNIEDLPYTPAVPLLVEQVGPLITYNKHDVNETEQFYFESLDAIEFREILTEKHNKNFLNMNDTKIGKQYFIMELERLMPGSCYIKGERGRELRQTKRDSMNLGSVVFPYVQFEQPAFQHVKNWLFNKTITATKGVFEFIDVSPEMASHMDRSKVRVHGLSLEDLPHLVDNNKTRGMISKGVPLDQCGENFLSRTDLSRFRFVSGVKDKSGLNCIVDGFRYDFGTGGIHGSVESTTVRSCDEYEIWDWDVASYYPNLAIANRLYPEHLSEAFCDIYQDVYLQRKQHAKGTAENAMLKLALNGVYGDSNSRYSPFYDPQYTMGITINGQLLLCMLAEQLIKTPGLQMIQINTDGLTVKCPRQYVDHMKAVCAWWEQITKLTLESAVYETMYIRDVNNYVAIYEGGGIKRKGAYEYERDWHQNHSAMVVPKAAEAVLLHGITPEQAVRGNLDLFDFMLAAKVGRADTLMHEFENGASLELQRISRYYISNTGGALVKLSPPAGGKKVGTWCKGVGVSEASYKIRREELLARASNYPPEDLDAAGVPWDPLINTKNRSQYKTRQTELNAGYLATECNDITKAVPQDINYSYYIEEVNKLIEPLKSGDY